MIIVGFLTRIPEYCRSVRIAYCARVSSVQEKYGLTKKNDDTINQAVIKKLY